MNRLTERGAFDAMREFLARHCRRMGADEVGGLLGDLEPMPDGRPTDGALHEEWKDIVEMVAPYGHRDAGE